MTYEYSDIPRFSPVTTCNDEFEFRIRKKKKKEIQLGEIARLSKIILPSLLHFKFKEKKEKGA